MLLSSVLIVATAWTFHSAPLAADEASGNEIAANVHTLRVPSRGSCGWWSTNAAIAPKGGVSFRAMVEIAMDDVRDFVHNDFAMFVRWDFPKDGKDRSKSGNGVDKGKFYQRDFVVYTDRIENGKIVRTFDETYAAPGESDSVEIEFIGKWHAMTATIREVKVENVERPKPRRVRCVVGNPYEATGNRIIATRRKAGETMMGEKTMAVQLAQIETCLTDIFAQVEKPDIILFADVGQWPGYETKRRFTLENCAIAEGDGK